MVTDRWSSILHPGILRLHSCFINQRALFFVHEYAPNARSLYDVYMNNFNIISQQQLNPLPERLVWSLIMQLISIIRAVHSANLACRSSLLPNHIMVTRNPTGAGNTTRVRIGSVGVIDALEFDSRKPLEELQNSDMLLLGRLIVGIATRTWIVPQKNSSSFTGKSSDEAQLRSCIAFMSNHYGNPSPDLTNLVMALLQFNSNNINNSKPPTIFELCSSAIVSNHALDELNGANSALDMYDTQLCNEYESGRGLRLLMKMGFINERPEHGFDREWAEMGDCYVLKLFRDYVFHQCDDMGRPVMDMGHVITALNKLDACDSEKIALASRDGNSLLVVSFADVARCLDSAYQQLCASCVPNPVFGGSDSTVGGNSLGSMAYSSVRRGGGGTRGNYIALYGTTSEQQEHQHYVSQYHHQRMMGLGVGMGMDDSAAGACVNDGTGTNTRNYANY